MAHLAICNTCGKINTVTNQCVFEAEIKSILELFIGNLDEIIETQGTFRSLEGFFSLLSIRLRNFIKADKLSCTNLVISQKLNALFTSYNVFYDNMI